MFQLNKRKIIIGILVWLLCLCLTYLVVNIFVLKTDKIEKKSKEKKKEYITGVDLYGYYDENDLVITEEVINNKVSYIKISGLIDKNIENSINTSIYDKVNELMNSYSDSYINFNVTANFGNLLSIRIWVNNENESHLFTLNYDLTSGNNLKFSNLFTDNADIYSILFSSIYNKLAYDKTYEERVGLFYREDISIYDYIDENGNIKYDADLSQIEDNTIKLVRKIKKEDIDSIKFYFDNKKIYMIYDGVTYDIEVSKNNDFIAFFNKYIKENTIYENNNIGKKHLAILRPYFCSINMDYYYDHIIDDNTITQIIIEGEEKNAPDYIEGVIDNIKEEINKYKNNLNDNNKHFISVYGYLSKVDDIDAYMISYNVNHYEIENSNFNVALKEIVKENKELIGRCSSDISLDEKTYISFEKDVLTNFYIIKDGNIKEAKNIFKKDSNFKEYLAYRFINCEYADYSYYKLDDVKDNLTYEFYNNVVLIKYDNKTVSVNYEDLKDFLNI